MTQLKEIQSMYQGYRSQKLKIRISVDQGSHLGFMKKKNMETIEK